MLICPTASETIHSSIHPSISSACVDFLPKFLALRAPPKQSLKQQLKEPNPAQSSPKLKNSGLAGNAFTAQRAGLQTTAAASNLSGPSSCISHLWSGPNLLVNWHFRHSILNFGFGLAWLGSLSSPWNEPRHFGAGHHAPCKQDSPRQRNDNAAATASRQVQSISPPSLPRRTTVNRKCKNLNKKNNNNAHLSCKKMQFQCEVFIHFSAML